MATQALARQRAFNPRDMHDDVYDLARVNPAALAKNVTRLARRKNQADGELDSAERTAIELVGMTTGVAVTALNAWWDGRIEAVRDAMLVQWEAQAPTESSGGVSGLCLPWEVPGVPDPGWIMGYIPKLLVIPAVAGVVAILAAPKKSKQGGRAPMPGFIATAAMRSAQFSFAYAVASWARAKGFCQREAQITSGTYQVSITPREDAAA